MLPSFVELQVVWNKKIQAWKSRYWSKKITNLCFPPFTSSIFSGPSPNCSHSTGSSQTQKSVRKKENFRKIFKTSTHNNDSPPRGARCDAHRGHHVNTVLPEVQPGEYIARWGGHAHGAVGQQMEARASVRRGDGGLQGEGSKVEKQSQEMVKCILRRTKREVVKKYVYKYAFSCAWFGILIDFLLHSSDKRDKKWDIFSVWHYLTEKVHIKTLRLTVRC